MTWLSTQCARFKFEACETIELMMTREVKKEERSRMGMSEGAIELISNSEVLK